MTVRIPTRNMSERDRVLARIAQGRAYETYQHNIFTTLDHECDASRFGFSGVTEWLEHLATIEHDADLMASV